MASIVRVVQIDEATYRDRDGEVERSQPYVVETTGPVTDLQIRRSGLIPRYRDPHPQGDSIVSEVEIGERRGYVRATSGIYDVTVRYTSDEASVPEEEDPTSRPTVTSMRSEKVRVRTVLDADGQPMLNTAGDLIEEEVDETHYVFHARRNFAALPRWIEDYADAVNIDDVRIRGFTWRAGHVRMEGISLPGELVWENGVPYIPFEWTARYRPRRPWNEPLLNRGFHELDAQLLEDAFTSGQDPADFRVLKPITIGDPEELITEPAWLDENGVAFRDAEGRVRVPRPEEIILLPRKRHLELPFRVLPW